MQKINRKLFGTVHVQVTDHPELHEQGDWVVYDDVCGTKYCVGGWALVHHAQQQGWEPELAISQIADRILGADYSSVRDAASLVLGLDEEEAYRLFYSVTNEEAVDMVWRYATGGRVAVNRKYGSV